MIIDKELVTPIAAISAAIFSIFGIVLNIINARVLNRREALRRILENELNALSGCLYSLMAFSQKMVSAKSAASFDNFRRLAEEKRGDINKIRSRVNYSLWGLDYGFLAIRAVPLYISHYKNTRPDGRANEIIKIGTRLRIALDKAILSTYISGSPPTILHRFRVRLWAWRLHRSFAKGRPTHERK